MEAPVVVLATDDAQKRDALAVRQEVFIREQGVPPALELDEHDQTALHFVAYAGRRPIGAARLRPYDSDTGKVERVAVLADWRGKGVGRLLMAVVEREAAARGFVRLRLNAQTHAEPFYRKLGYETVSAVFEEAGIPHVTMVKTLNP